MCGGVVSYLGMCKYTVIGGYPEPSVLPLRHCLLDVQLDWRSRANAMMARSGWVNSYEVRTKTTVLLKCITVMPSPLGGARCLK